LSELFVHSRELIHKFLEKLTHVFLPVGDKNQMVVRIEGGYKQITLRTLEKIAAAKP
jgi:hypothetical protein